MTVYANCKHIYSSKKRHSKNKILEAGWSHGYIVVQPRSTRDIEIMLFILVVKVPVVGNTADTPNPPGLLPF